MGIKSAFDRFEHWLEGRPSGVLSVVLIAVALLLIVAAFRARGWEKAAIVAWVLFP